MAAHHIDFWFTMGSTYSYLSVSRLADVERSTGVTFRWRPFHLLIILQEMKHVPFADKPTKSAYMWRDIERRAAMYGIPMKLQCLIRPSSRWSRIWLPPWVRARAGAQILSARHIGDGSSAGRKQAASQMYRKACTTLERSQNACSHWRIPRTRKPHWPPKRTPHASLVSSDRRHSASAANCFGATTGSLMPSAGAILAAFNMTRSSYCRRFHLSQVEY
jgi:DSBA-like thioredoxin domain